MVAWTLVFHLIGLVFWLGSLLVVTRILAIHTEEKSPEAHLALERLETKLLRGLAHPGAALMVITGFLLVSQDPHVLGEHWLHAKLLFVVILVVLDLRVTVRARAFQQGKTELSRRECMVLHGAISLVFFAILILVLVKPFGLHRRQARVGGTGKPITEACLRPKEPWPVATLPVPEAALARQEGMLRS
jgi:putative membrane protein